MEDLEKKVLSKENLDLFLDVISNRSDINIITSGDHVFESITFCLRDMFYRGDIFSKNLILSSLDKIIEERLDHDYKLPFSFNNLNKGIIKPISNENLEEYIAILKPHFIFSFVKDKLNIMEDISKLGSELDLEKSVRISESFDFNLAKLIRKKSKLTRNQLAIKVNRSYIQIQRMEDGITKLFTSSMCKYSKTLYNLGYVGPISRAGIIQFRHLLCIKQSEIGSLSDMTSLTVSRNESNSLINEKYKPYLKWLSDKGYTPILFNGIKQFKSNEELFYEKNYRRVGNSISVADN